MTELVYFCTFIFPFIIFGSLVELVFKKLLKTRDFAEVYGIIWTTIPLIVVPWSIIHDNCISGLSNKIGMDMPKKKKFRCQIPIFVVLLDSLISL